MNDMIEGKTKKREICIIMLGIFLLVSTPFFSIMPNLTSASKTSQEIDITPTEENTCNCNTFIDGEHALGLLPGFPPDFEPPQPTTITGNPPASWDWRSVNGQDWTTPIKDQKNCGSCYVFAIIAALETVYNIKNNNPNLDIDLSEQFVVSSNYSYLLDSFNYSGCCGRHILSTVQFLRLRGTIEEKYFQYAAVDAYGRNYSDCPNSTSAGVPSHDPVFCPDDCSKYEKIKIKGRYYLPNDEETVKNAVAAYGPVITGMTIYEDFYYNYNYGIYEHVYGDSVGSHAIAIVGYNDSLEDLNQPGYWICRNSWGTDWGETKNGEPNNGNDGGWFRVKYGEIDISYNNNCLYFKDYVKVKQKSYTAKNDFLVGFAHNYPYLFQLFQRFLNL